MIASCMDFDRSVEFFSVDSKVRVRGLVGPDWVFLCMGSGLVGPTYMCVPM